MRPPALVYLAVYVLAVVTAAITGAVVGYSWPADSNGAMSADKYGDCLRAARDAALWAAVLGALPLAAIAAGYSIVGLRAKPLHEAVAEGLY